MGGSNKESESEVDHKAGNSKQIMNFFSVQKHLLSKLLLLELSVVGSQWQKCEVFISGGGSSPKFARCQSEARLCGVAVLCQTQVAGEPCGRALSAYSGGCQCQVMRISLLPEAKNFFFFI